MIHLYLSFSHRPAAVGAEIQSQKTLIILEKGIPVCGTSVHTVILEIKPEEPPAAEVFYLLY